MADDVAIKVYGVHKVFKLPHEKQSSLKSTLINLAKRKKGYEIQHVLKGVSFEVKKGDFFAIVGRNGSGKSTLLKLLAGIYVPNQGAVQVNGKLTPFIELGVGFNPELTGRENVFLNGALLGFNRAEMEAMYDDIVTFAELERFMDQKLKNYSSGMQVRLAFSIAIRAKSDILLIDEVLAVGDESFQRKCMDYFVKLKQNKQTVVFVTHDMAQVRRFCDRAVYIEDGEILIDGATSEVAEMYTSKNLELRSERSASTTAAAKPRKAEFKAKFLNGDRIQYGQQLKLSITWDSSLPVKNVGVGVIKDTGEYVFATNTIIDNVSVKGTEIQYTLDCNLIPAKYTLAVGVFGDSDVEIIGYEPNHAEFVVEPIKGMESWAGLTKLNHAWEQ